MTDHTYYAGHICTITNDKNHPSVDIIVDKDHSRILYNTSFLRQIGSYLYASLRRVSSYCFVVRESCCRMGYCGMRNVPNTVM